MQRASCPTMTSEVERWHIGGRYYVVTVATTPDSIDLELDDLGPEVGRGTVAIASKSDASGTINLRVFPDHELPIEVVEQFTAEARYKL